jgi:hypothetical protein
MKYPDPLDADPDFVRKYLGQRRLDSLPERGNPDVTCERSVTFGYHARLLERPDPALVEETGDAYPDGFA